MLSLQKTIGNFFLLKILGEGTYSTVYQAKNIETHEINALKVIKLEEFDAKEIENILNEVRILSSLNHPNIIRYVNSFVLEEEKQLW